MDDFPPGFLQQLNEYVGMLKALGFGNMADEIGEIRDDLFTNEGVSSPDVPL